MFIVGLTGGIGSGKTAASDYFAKKNITVVDADRVSRLVVKPGSDALKIIVEHFTAEHPNKTLLNRDGSLDRKALRKIVFDNPSERLWLESLLHPLIASEIERQLQASLSPYTLLVSPILFESGQNLYVQRSLVIDTPESLQISRTALRDNTDESGVKAIMKAQSSREKRCELADDIVLNNASLESLYKKLDGLHAHYLTLANSHH